MARTSKPIKKKKVDFNEIKKKFSSIQKYKEQEFYDLGEVFHDACGLPGPAIGQINQLIGHSDTGKTTALLKAAVDAQKRGHIPVFIITEQKFSFEHAKLMGLDCEYVEEDVIDEKTGEVTGREGYWDGPLLYQLGFDYVEQVFDYMNELLDAQKKGELPYSLCFLIDSIGTIPCKMSYEGKGGNMHTARVISEKWGMGLAQRITSSRKLDFPYTNTAVIINQAWVLTPMNAMGQPKIMPKGGQSIFYSSGLVFLFGNQANAGISKISATSRGRKVNFATRTKVGVLKNHINGLGYADGKIIVGIHDFIKDDKSNKYVKEYKQTHVEYFNRVFDTVGTTAEEIELGEDAVEIPVDYQDIQM